MSYTPDKLNNLTEKEKEIALKILEELSTNGNSKIYDNLLYADYKEIPVDIETFLTDDNYLGKAWKDVNGKSKLYPFWLEKLKELFPNNLDTNYNTLLESGARGLGKAQPLDSLIFAENGYIRMGDIKLGDKVYGNDGKLHEVIGVYPQGLKPVYKLTFTDKSSTLAAEEHLWTVRDNNDMKMKTLTTKEIIDLGLLRGNKLSSGKYREARFKLPLTEPLVFKHKDTFISPYLMGCLLGDGCFSRCISLTTFDNSIKDYFINELNSHNYKAIIDRHTYIIASKQKTKYNEYKEEIIRLGLYHHTAKDKFIPNDYLYNDIDSRLALLQGLMDTYGTINKNGSNMYLSTISKKLAENTLFLVQSLGGTGHIKINTNNKYRYKGEYRNCSDNYIVTIKLPYILAPFKLGRKLSRLNKNRLDPQRNIKNIEYISDQECQCIVIDSDDHLYLTNDLIVTHNSEIACGAVCPYLMYRIMCLKNPLEYYHIKLTEKIAFAFMNIKLELAEKIAIDKFQKTIQMSPWFMAKGSMGQFHNNPYWTPPAPLEIIIGSQSDDVIGRPIMFAFFDEISFLKNKNVEEQKIKAKDMINTAKGGMKTRFIHKGKNPTLLVVASSKRSEQSFMETYIKELSETDNDNTLIVDEPVWKVKPKGTYKEETFYIGLGNKHLDNIVIPRKDYDDLNYYKKKGYNLIEMPVDFEADAMIDLNRVLCDYAGISNFSSNKFISPERLSNIISKSIFNPLPDKIICGNDPNDKSEYKDWFNFNKLSTEYLSKPLYIHLDMSLSGDKTGIAGVWIIGKKPTSDGNPGKDLVFRPAFSTSIEAPRGHQVSFEKNRNFIRWLKSQGFNIKTITSDTYQSADLQQQLKSEGFNCNILSVDRVEVPPGEKVGICKPYQYLKNVIYENRLMLYEDDLLYKELSQLEINNTNGKVDHPEKGSKDQADALCLDGDTKIYTLSGKNPTLRDLYFNHKDEWILAYNIESHKLEPVKIKEVIDNGVKDNMIELTLDNSEKLICTDDHLLLCKDGSYIQAGKSLNKSLMPFMNENNSELNSYTYDRKVISIKKTYARNVFDIKLDRIHNFALYCGIFAHNCGATYTASLNAEQFAFDFGETLEVMMDVGTKGALDEREQMQISFQEEIQRLFDPIARSSEQQVKVQEKPVDIINPNNAKFNDTQNNKINTKPQEQAQKEKPAYMDFGLGPAQVLQGQQYIQNGILWW